MGSKLGNLFSVILSFNSSTKMSSTLTSTLTSPFVSSLPASHVFFSYDADGDCIMTDAVTGLPITYGTASGSKRSRSDSVDDDSVESRSSKRSRSSDDDGEQDGSASTPSSGLSIRTPRAPVGFPVNECPPAPKKLARVSSSDDDHDEGYSPLRNLAESMAEAVLAGEPRGDLSPIAPWEDTPLLAVATTTSSSNAAAVPLPVSPATVPDVPATIPPASNSWCVSVTCSDLALRLDMRHPRVVLHLLRFISSYNELAPEDEQINLPYLEADIHTTILSHESVVNPAPEFAGEVAELKALVDEFSCQCPDCEPDNWSDSHYGDYFAREDDDDSEDDRDSREGCGCEQCNPY